jgi:hypothetical protein
MAIGSLKNGAWNRKIIYTWDFPLQCFSAGRYFKYPQENGGSESGIMGCILEYKGDIIGILSGNQTWLAEKSPN